MIDVGYNRYVSNKFFIHNINKIKVFKKDQMVKLSYRNWQGKIRKSFDLKAHLYDNIVKHCFYTRETYKEKYLSSRWKDFLEFSEMIKITPNITIKEDEVKFYFIRASGPGGQNVNKVATAVQLRFDAKNSPAFSDDVRNRLICLAGRRITEHGILIIEAKRFRSQKQNRKNAVNRLIKLIRKASEKPKIRIKTKESLASKKRILEAKKHRAKIKKMRRPVSIHND